MSVIEKTQPAVVHYALEDGAVELREVEVPEIDDESVLLEVGAVSVCGSDVHQMHNTHSWTVNIPVTLGHEFAGTVARVGRNVRNFKEGDRVVSETAAVICGHCIPCRTGQYNLCRQRKGFGYGVDGAMTRFVKTPGRCLHHIPKTLAFNRACLTEPTAVAYNAMCANSIIRPGDFVVVIGPGPIGLLCARMAALSGARPLVVAGRTADFHRLETAQKLGATHVINVDDASLEHAVFEINADGADLVCDASGASSPLQMALKLARPDGQVTKVGWSPSNVPIDLNPLVQGNVRLQGSFSHNYPMWEKVIGLLTEDLIMADEIVGLETTLEDWAAAFEAMHSGRIIKSVLLPGT
jgi:alcohol dehydrogenase/L-iditol 2-dehydrogenase